MNEPGIKKYNLRIDSVMLEKFHVVCDYEGRSVNSQLLQYVKKAVSTYEEKYGVIPVKDDAGVYIQEITKV